MAEKTKGGKRHIAADVMGNLPPAVVHAANIHDAKSGIEPARLAFERYPAIPKFCADAGYRGAFIFDVDEILKLGVDISAKIKPHEWEKLPWRWLAECAFGWLNNARRLSEDYEITTPSAEAIATFSHPHTLLKRL